jgi:hypothetical protein
MAAAYIVNVRLARNQEVEKEARTAIPNRLPVRTATVSGALRREEVYDLTVSQGKRKMVLSFKDKKLTARLYGRPELGGDRLIRRWVLG